MKAICFIYKLSVVVAWSIVIWLFLAGVYEHNKAEREYRRMVMVSR